MSDYKLIGGKNFNSLAEFQTWYSSKEVRSAVKGNAVVFCMEDVACVVFADHPTYRYRVRDAGKKQWVQSDFAFVSDVEVVGDIVPRETYLSFLASEVISGGSRGWFNRIRSWLILLASTVMAVSLAFTGAYSDTIIILSTTLVVLGVETSVFVAMGDRLSSDIIRNPRLLRNTTVHKYLRTDYQVLLTTGAACGLSIIGSVIASLGSHWNAEFLPGIGLLRSGLAICVLMVSWTTLWSLVSVLPYVTQRASVLRTRDAMDSFFESMGAVEKTPAPTSEPVTHR